MCKVGGSQKSVIPLVVLCSGEVPGREQLVQQPSHMFTSNGTALQCGLDAMPHKDEKQAGRGQLLHTLHCLLQEAQVQEESSQCLARTLRCTAVGAAPPSLPSLRPSHHQPSCH